MFQRRRARILLAVLVILSIVLITIDFRSEAGGPLDRARGGATAVFRPVQDGVATLLQPLGDTFSSVGELFRLRSENRRLRDEVDRLAQRSRSRTDLERENAELLRLLEVRDRIDFETVAARTVALGPSNFEWMMTIDVGSTSGVERDMPVVNGSGLVGRVIQVTPDASRVLLAIDPNFSAAARSARTGEIGSVDGRGGDPMLMRPLDREGDIVVGDEIVTSSYRGGVFPAGIPIGTVAEVVDTGNRDTREFLISPFVDFTQVNHVLVVKSGPVEDVPPLSGTDGLEFVRPPVESTIDSPGASGRQDRAPDDGEDDADGEASDGSAADGSGQADG